MTIQDMQTNMHVAIYCLCLTVFLILSSSVSLSMNFLSLLSVIIIPMYMSLITNLELLWQIREGPCQLRVKTLGTIIILL